MRMFYAAGYFVLAHSTVAAAVMINRHIKREQTGTTQEHKDIVPADVRWAQFGEVVSGVTVIPKEQGITEEQAL